MHGQYFGQWLLNNNEELNKVENEVLSFFNSIKTRRTWIIVGYSGNDGIFNKIKSLGSFSNELFWVKKQLDSEDDEHVLEFLKTPNINAHSIEGYYADSFFLKLHAELSILDNKLSPPDVFYKPFTYLKSVMNNVSEINDNDELNKNVKSIIDNCNSRINKAINAYENNESIEDFKQEILDAILKSQFNKDIADKFYNEIKAKEYLGAEEILSNYYNSWGNELYDLFKESEQKHKILLDCIEVYKKAIEINPNNSYAYSNWGLCLSHLAEIDESEKVFLESIMKFNKSIEINKNNYLTYNALGNTLQLYAKLKKSEKLFIQSFEQYSLAAKLNPKYDSVYNNWGNSIQNLAELKSDKLLFEQSFEKYKRAIEINSNNDSAYDNWSSSYLKYHYIVKDNKIKNNALLNAKEKAENAYSLNNNNTYNLACCYSLMNEKEKALEYLYKSLSNEKISVDHVKKDKDWTLFKKDKDFIKLLSEF